MKKARRNPNADEADRLFKSIDKDENGNISVSEVHEAIKKQYPDWHITDIRATVARFDADGDGKINREEFGEALKAMQDKPDAKKRAKPGEKKVNRAWTFKNAPKPAPAPKQQSSAVLLSEEKTLTEEELQAAEKLMKERNEQRQKDAAAEQAAAANAAAAPALTPAEKAAAEERQSKIEAKIAEAQASVLKKQQDESAKLQKAAADQLYAEKAAEEAERAKEAERARKAQEYLDAEKLRMQPEEEAKKEAARRAEAEREAEESQNQKALKSKEAALEEEDRAREAKEKEKSDKAALSKSLQGEGVSIAGEKSSRVFS